MGVVVPSILTSSRADLTEKLTKLRGLVDAVQIDVVDGKFAKPPTWPYSEGAEVLNQFTEAPDALHAFGEFRYELDLMVKNPEESAGAWISAGATRIVIHVESTTNLESLLSTVEQQYGHDKGFAPDLLSLGLSLNIATDTAVLDPFLERIEYVQFMGIATIGKQGQRFDERVLEKIAAFKKEHRQVPIQVDGGVSLGTAPKLLAVGVERLVVGSDLWEAEDLATELSRFERIAENYGTYT